MKKNVKLIGAITAVACISFTSCKKDNTSPINSFNMEVAAEEANLRLSTSNYQTNIFCFIASYII